MRQDTFTPRTRSNLRLRTALAVAAIALASAPTAGAATTVNLRVEGQSTTLFEGAVSTDGKTLTKDASGPHPCDGTNGGANPTAGPTMTSALDDGLGGDWTGTWFSGFEDFGIDSIKGEANDFGSGAFWGYALDFVPSQVGGCQQQVSAGQEVLFAYDFFSKAHLLKLTGPLTGTAGAPITVKVVCGQCGTPAGATLTGTGLGTSPVTDSNGEARFELPAGTYNLKAERADSVRSNRLSITVAASSTTTTTTTPAPGGTSGGEGTSGGGAPGAPAAPFQGVAGFGSISGAEVYAALRDGVQTDDGSARGGMLRRSFSNPFGFALTGVVSYRAVGRVVPIGSLAHSSASRRSVALGRAGFVAPPRGRVVVGMRLSRAQRQLLGRAGRLVVRQRTRFRDPSGVVRTVVTRFTLNR